MSLISEKHSSTKADVTAFSPDVTLTHHKMETKALSHHQSLQLLGSAQGRSGVTAHPFVDLNSCKCMMR